MWDFIIVGAGTAGSVLAHALTASGRNRVLLIEAGGKPNLTVAMPAGMVKLFRTKLDWSFESEPQQACGNRIIFTPRGRMLGGSANMNAQIHQWCHPADFDGWEALGAAGWGWRDVAPVFRAMEQYSGGATDDQSRGRLGPMRIASIADPHPVAVAFVEAARSAGLNATPGYNGAAYSGAWLVELAHHKGRRFSVFDAYLKPAMARSNLTVMTGAQVERIAFEGRRAAAVRLVGRRDPLRATRGIILSAGAFGTPQLLMLSGIGPVDHLRGHGLEIVLDRPEVGGGLQDHPLSALKFAMRRPLSMKSAESLGQLARWLFLRRGMLASNGVEAIAFTNVLGGAAPDLELILALLEWRAQALEPPQVHAYSIGISPCAPRSRGRVRLRSASPIDSPMIDFGLLTDPDGVDARVLAAGAKLARRLAATEPLAGETAGELTESACCASDEALLAHLKSEIQTVYHPTGTCRMGSDAAAPLDPRLRFRGLDGLWVADASVMPTVPRGHPNAVVAMIASRAAEWIERDASAPAAIVSPVVRVPAS